MTEFSRPISLSRLPPTGLTELLVAKPGERVALAKRFELIELSELTATLSLQPQGNGVVAVQGTLSADLAQKCVITLEPLPSHIDLKLAVLLMPEGNHPAHLYGTDQDEEMDSEHDIEFYTGGVIDLGELVSQHLGIAIDPYPRKAGAQLPQTEFGAPYTKESPLAVLTKLTNQQNNKDK